MHHLYEGRSSFVGGPDVFEKFEIETFYPFVEKKLYYNGTLILAGLSIKKLFPERDYILLRAVPWKFINTFFIK